MKTIQSIHYPHAPIKEAIIDFQLQLPSKVTVEQLQKIASETNENYPVVEDFFVNTGEIKFLPDGKEPSITSSHQKTGILCKGEGGQQLYQARIDGFSFNRLAPYTDWESFRTEAKKIWTLYKKVAQPEKIKRIALRYINLIDIPSSTVNFEDFIRTYPEISADLPQAVANFFMQLQIPLTDIKSMLSLTQTVITPSKEGVVSTVLDIDIFCDKEPPQQEDDIWAAFEILRERKNFIFESCITDKTRELFK